MNWLKRNYLSVFTVAAVIVIAVVIFLFRGQIDKLDKFGYLGAFLVSLIGSLTIVLPVPGILILIALSTVFNPFLIALAGSTGGTIGELSGYVLGYSGRHMFGSNKQYIRTEAWMKKWGVWAIAFFAFIPILPTDIAGIASGALRFPVWKFFIACWTGKTLKYILLIIASMWGWQFIQQFIPVI